jgi:hypothetical protein
MRASSLHAQGGAFNEPRHDLADRRAAAARHPGRRLFGYFFFAVEEKVTRSQGCERKNERTRSEQNQEQELDDQPFGC